MNTPIRMQTHQSSNIQKKINISICIVVHAFPISNVMPSPNFKLRHAPFSLQFALLSAHHAATKRSTLLTLKNNASDLCNQFHWMSRTTGKSYWCVGCTTKHMVHMVNVSLSPCRKAWLKWFVHCAYSLWYSNVINHPNFWWLEYHSSKRWWLGGGLWHCYTKIIVYGRTCDTYAAYAIQDARQLRSCPYDIYMCAKSWKYKQSFCETIPARPDFYNLLELANHQYQARNGCWAHVPPPSYRLFRTWNRSFSCWENSVYPSNVCSAYSFSL